MMTLKEAVDDLEAGTSSVEDVEKKILAAGCTLTAGTLRCETCPVSQYLTKKTGKTILVGDLSCNDHFGDMVSLPIHIANFIRIFDIAEG